MYIKLQDFAKSQGVTDRQVQRLLKKYESELLCLFERRGQLGTWLSEEACEILRSKMKQPPAPVIFEEDPRVEKLEARVSELETLIREKDQMLTISQNATQEAQNRVNSMLEEVQRVKALEDGQKLLEANNEELKQKVAETEKTAQKAKLRVSEYENMSVLNFIKQKLKKGKVKNESED